MYINNTKCDKYLLNTENTIDSIKPCYLRGCVNNRWGKVYSWMAMIMKLRVMSILPVTYSSELQNGHFLEKRCCFLCKYVHKLLLTLINSTRETKQGMSTNLMSYKQIHLQQTITITTIYIIHTVGKCTTNVTIITSPKLPKKLCFGIWTCYGKYIIQSTQSQILKSLKNHLKRAVSLVIFG